MQLNENLLQKISSHVVIFKSMPRQCLINTLNCADNWPIKKGDPFFQEGERGASFFILLAGEVTVEKLTNGKPLVLATLKAGDCFGEMALVDGKPRSATIRATQDTISLRFSQEKIDAYPEAASYVYRNISKVLVSRLSESNTTNTQLQTKVAELIQKAEAAANPAKAVQQVVRMG